MKTPAHSQLKKWLEQERGRASALADRIGAVKQTVAAWKRPPARPNVRFWLPIEEATGGCVRAVDWALNEEERQIAEALVASRRAA